MPKINFAQILRRYSPEKIAGLRYAKLFYSQFGEDVFLESLLDITKNISYVDVGAYHPFHLSNTCRLYQMGCRGINIEPQPENIKLFQKFRPEDVNLNLAVGEKEGIFELSFSGTNATLLDTDVIGRASDSSVPTRKVQVKSLASILHEHQDQVSSFGFLSIDCEGFDLSVLKSNDWNRFRPKVIAVEDHSECQPSDISSFLAQQGYDFVSRLRITSFFRIRE